MRVVLILSLLAIGSSAYAQGGPALDEPFQTSPSDISLGTDPDLWFYLHEQKRYDDPKQAVRRKAEQKAAERMSRLAAMKWFGLSNSRPRAEITPFMSFYSPSWVGNGRLEDRWYGAGNRPSVHYHIER